MRELRRNMLKKGDRVPVHQSNPREDFDLKTHRLNSGSVDSVNVARTQ